MYNLWCNKRVQKVNFVIFSRNKAYDPKIKWHSKSFQICDEGPSVAAKDNIKMSIFRGDIKEKNQGQPKLTMCTNIFNGHSKNKTIKNLNRGTLIVDISIPRNHVFLGENPNPGAVLIIHHLSVRTTSDDPQALQPLATCIWLLSITEDLTVSYILVPRHIEPSWSRAKKFLSQSTKRYYWRRCLRHLPQMLAACITILASRTRCAH